MNNTTDVQLRTDYREIAAHMAEKLGAECFPVNGKQPVTDPTTGIEYQWRQKALGKPGCHETPLWQYATGYAVAPCEGSHLVILDVDDHNDPTVQHLISDLGLQYTFTVQRGNHRHYYFKVSYPLPKAWLTIQQLDLSTMKKREIVSLRGFRAYVVGPGSEHPESGDTYERVGQWGVATLSEPQTKLLYEAFHFDWRQARDSAVTMSANAKAVRDGVTVNPELINEIIRRLGIYHGKPLLFSQAGTASLYKNPMRSDDENRSAFFNRHTGYIHDAATKEYWSCVQVCNFLNIRMKSFGGLSSEQPAQPKQLPTAAATTKPAPYESDLPSRRLNFWRDGIPDPLRELFLNIDNQTGLSDQAAGLVVWELWTLFVRKSLIGPHEPVTVARLVGLAEDIGWDTTRWTIEKGLDQLLAWGILRDVGDDIQSDMGGREESQNDVPKTQQNSVGRPSKKYRFRKLKAALLSITQKVRYRIREWCMGQVPDAPQPDWFAVAGEWKAEIVRQRDLEKMQAVDQMARAKAAAKYEKAAKLKEDLLNLQSLLNSPSTPLVDGEYQNTRMYRDNLYLSYVQANPGRQITRAAAAKQIGRSADALTAAGKRAGVERIPEYKYWEIFPGDVRKQIEKVAAWSFDHAGSSLIAVMGDDKTNYDYGCPLDNPHFQSWTDQRFKDGFRVFLRVQVASREKVGTPQPTQPKSRSVGASSASKSEGGKVTVWSRYNPDFVARQLKMRGLQETSDGRGLIDLDAGGVILEPDNAVAA